jgi:uncharacterized membrane protein
MHALGFWIIPLSTTVMQLNLNDILTILSILAVAMLVILLYHLIFASVSLRRIADRMDQMSKDVEAVILKPIGAIDYMLDWVLSMVDTMRVDSEHKKKHHK